MTALSQRECSFIRQKLQNSEQKVKQEAAMRHDVSLNMSNIYAIVMFLQRIQLGLRCFICDNYKCRYCLVNSYSLLLAILVLLFLYVLWLIRKLYEPKFAYEYLAAFFEYTRWPKK